MAVYDLYSKRQKAPQDVFIYDELSDKIRTQIYFVIEDFCKENRLKYAKTNFFKIVFEVLTREHGVEHLDPNPWKNLSIEAEIKNYLLYEKDVEKVLDTIEIHFKIISNFAPFLNGTPETTNSYRPEDAINDLNMRFRENGIGYKFEAGVLIKIDNELLHNEITKPALSYLVKEEYHTINDEFHSAYKHYRHGNFKECLNECLKSLETTIKVICDKKSWEYSNKDTSSKLIQIVFEKKLIPDYLQSEITSLRATIESGIPTIRNKNSGHGQGVDKITVDESLVSYTLNLTGSSIKFLLELYEASIKDTNLLQ